MRLSVILGSFISLTYAGLITVTRIHSAICPATSLQPTWMPSSSASPPTPSSSSVISISLPSPPSSTSVSTGPPSPSPSTNIDTAINSGAPFKLQLLPIGGTKKKRAPLGTWIQADGYLTSDPSKGATFSLNDGQLHADDLLESTSYEFDSQIFAGALSDSVGPITRLFEVTNGIIHWYSGAFDGGEALFYYAPPPKTKKRQVAGNMIMAKFHGTPDPSWQAVVLSGALVNIPSSSAVALPPTSSNEDERSSVQSSNVLAGPIQSSSIQAGPLPVQSSRNQAIQTTMTSSLMGSSGISAQASSMMGSSTASPPMSSSAGQVVSFNGMCGPKYNGMTCSSSSFGSCCSRYGVCGDEADFCMTGCQSLYGDCSMSSLSDVAVSTVSSSQPSSIAVGSLFLSLSALLVSVPAFSSQSAIVLPITSVMLTKSSFTPTASSSKTSSLMFSSSNPVISSSRLALSSSSMASSMVASSSVITMTSSSTPAPMLGSTGSPSLSSSNSKPWSTSSWISSTMLSSSSTSIPGSSSLMMYSSSALPSSLALVLSSSSAITVYSSSAKSPSSSTTPSPTTSTASSVAPCTNVATPLSCTNNLSNGSFYSNAQVNCAVGYNGADLSNIPTIQGNTANTLEICIDRCVNTTGCAAGTWGVGSKACYLKSAVGIRSVASTLAFWFPYPELNCSSSLLSLSASSMGVSSTIATGSSAVMAPSSSQNLALSLSSSSTLISSMLSSSAMVGVSSSFAAMAGSSSTASSALSSTSSTTSPSASAGSSSKRGLVYVPSNVQEYRSDDLIWVQPGSPISWYYNYDYISSPVYDNYPQIQFVPMLWGDYNNSFFDTVTLYKNSGKNITHVLGFNEPDGPGAEGGSNITPASAAARWISDIEPLRQYGIKLGAPAVTGSPRGFTWLQNWLTACNGRCNPDFMVVHYYGPFGNIAGDVGQMNGTYFPKPIWVTEFGDSHDMLASTQSNYNTTISYFDRIPIERYSYFGAFRSDVSNVGDNGTFLDQCGRLTDIGAWYLNIGAQAKGIIPQSTACATGSSFSSSVLPSSSGIMAISSSSSQPVSSSARLSSSVIASSSSAMAPSPSPPVMPSSSVTVGTATISSTVFLSPSPGTSSSSSAAVPSSVASSSTSSSTTPLPTCYRTDLSIGPLATGLPDIACITNAAYNDDYYSSLTLPFNVSISSTIANVIFVSTNGFITTGLGSSQYNHQALPSTLFESSVTGVVLPLWTDMAFDMKETAITSGGVYYIITPTSVSIEWVGHPNYDDQAALTFSASYSTTTPGVWTYRYYSIYDSGASATVGIQGPGYTRAAQFSLDQANVPAGTQVVCDSNAGTCSSSTFALS